MPSNPNKVIISDTACLIGLTNIGQINLLRKIYGSIMETENALLIVDDKRARQFALGLGLEIIGTLGLLIRAYEKGIIQDIDSIIASLREIGFRLPANAEALIKAIITRMENYDKKKRPLN